MKIVVDSNIVFSAILNSQSKIGQLLINGSKYFSFYSAWLLKEEINNHKDKILHLTRYTHHQFDYIFQLTTGKITFIDDILLTDKELNSAIDMVSDVDANDALFVALAIHLSANLWTGDKQLIKGLRKKGYSKIINTDELFHLFLNKQLKTKRNKK